MKRYEKQVSVIMGVYNQQNKEILYGAVNSILKQTLEDFEFIIYDDGSVESVANDIRNLALLDERIVIIGKEENHGLAFSLNECIKNAKGKYIARMDADDISLPTRLEIQVEFLEKHQEFMWCGTNAAVFDEMGIWGERKMPELPVREDYLKYSPYIHPSVMYRAEIFETMDGYKVSSETLRCEDYEMFMRFQQAGYKGYNIQERLLLYRENAASYERRQFAFRVNEMKVRFRNFKKMGLLFPMGWIYVLRPIAGGIIPRKLLRWLKHKEANEYKAYEKENRLLQPYIARETNF